MTALGVLSPIRAWVFWVAALLVVLGAVRRAPKDRVLLCQCIAFGALVALMVLKNIVTARDWLVFALAATTASFAIFAGYFGLMNILQGWVERRKGARQR
jgi:hypothetical protein